MGDLSRPFETWVPWRESPHGSKRRSLRVYPYKSTWLFKDMSRGESGDAYTFYCQCTGRNPKEPDTAAEFLGLGSPGKVSALVSAPVRKVDEPLPEKPTPPSTLRTPTDEEILQISRTREGIAPESIAYAIKQGWIFTGRSYGQESWFLTDKTGWSFQATRLDGKLFPEYKRKDGSVIEAAKTRNERGSSVSRWLQGAADVANRPTVCLVEGRGDFLAAVDFIRRADLTDQVAPLAVYGSGQKPRVEDLRRTGVIDAIAGKNVILFEQNDDAGRKEFTPYWTGFFRELGNPVHVVSIDKVAASLAKPGEDLSKVKDLNNLTRYASRLDAWRLFGKFHERSNTQHPPTSNPLPSPVLPAPDLEPSPDDRLVDEWADANAEQEAAGYEPIESLPLRSLESPAAQGEPVCEPDAIEAFHSSARRDPSITEAREEALKKKRAELPRFNVTEIIPVFLDGQLSRYLIGLGTAAKSEHQAVLSGKDASMAVTRMQYAMAGGHRPEIQIDDRVIRVDFPRSAGLEPVSIRQSGQER